MNGPARPDRPATPHDNRGRDTTPTHRQLGSRQVNWWSTYEFAAKHAAGLGVNLTDRMPLAGTPAWARLADDDPRKAAALLLRGVQAALADDTSQAVLADASGEIAAAAPWSELARAIHRGRGTGYVPRRKSA